MTILSVKNLTKRFGKNKDIFVAVDNLSFTMDEGEILGILGPNGAGKTTTIQMLLGVLTPTSGTIEYFGKSLAKDEEAIKEQINFSSTYINLPWRLTVKENLTYISYLYDIADRKGRLKKIIEIFRLGELLNQPMNDLSAGQLTRVNLAKSLINFPKVLLLDEPTASLDPEVAGYIREFLRDQRSKFQMSIIFTSHNMAEVEEMCDRIVFINHGKVIADDTPDKLAKTIEFSHIDLRIKHDIEKAIKYCKEQKLTYKHEGAVLMIYVKERDIAHFLKNITDQGITYDEISIEKPSLEDYFMQVATEKKPE